MHQGEDVCPQASPEVNTPPAWSGVSPQTWNDWRWQYRNRITSVDSLATLLSISPANLPTLSRVTQVYHMSVTPYYLSLIRPGNPDDPILLQSLPDPRELMTGLVGVADPLEEEVDSPVPGLVHRYPDRVLMVVTNVCAMYCRHCTRKRLWRCGESIPSLAEVDRMIDYVAKTSEVREVVISGGDPLTLPLPALERILARLRAIPHLEIIRIGSRVPVVMPQRITPGLCRTLARYHPIWVNTQFNHPNEITPESTAACDLLLAAGIPLNNQSVLLRGINDDPQTMTSLCHALQRIRVRPYYLFQCDPVQGTEHLRTPVWTGIEIMEQMRGYTSGLCIPTFVVDAPGGGGKIPLNPQYMVSMTQDSVVLRNYEGMIFSYYTPERSRRRRRRSRNGQKASSAGMMGTTVRLERRRRIDANRARL